MVSKKKCRGARTIEKMVKLLKEEFNNVQYEEKGKWKPLYDVSS